MKIYSKLYAHDLSIFLKLNKLQFLTELTSIVSAAINKSHGETEIEYNPIFTYKN